MREFETGATRDDNQTKLDYRGFLDPLVLKKFAEYMHRHRKQSDGTMRSSDNWKKGIPLDAYMESMHRHFHDLWMEHEGYESREGIKDALMGLMFNILGYSYEIFVNEK